MKIQLHVDSRSSKFQASKTFGEIVSFSDEFTITERIPDVIQPAGDTECLAISSCDVAGDKDGVVYVYQDLFDRIPHSANGAIPQDAFNETVKGGLLPQEQTNRIKVFNSYYQAHTGSQDAFDSVRSALLKVGYPVIAYTNYYQNWQGQVVLPLGQTPISGHAYTIEGWKQMNGETMLVCEMWLGHKVYMSRAVFNDAVGKWGCGTAVFSTLQQDISTRRGWIMTAIDACKNAILLLMQLKQQTMPEPQLSTPLSTNLNTINNHTKIEEWAEAIKQVEGWTPGSPSMTHNNPGNLGYTTLTASWGAIQGGAKSDGGHFCRFPDYATGFKALCNFLTLGAQDELKAFHQSRTLELFSEKYGNTGIGYAQQIARVLGLPLSTDVSTFL